ncbi:MAG: aminopeptidase P family protein [Bradyrhizobium sp.]|nr:MAG: aminopeptidase P family protein [Bradyrhizobium sp.]
MYQSFAEQGGPTFVAQRIAALRAELVARGLDGFIAPRADEHQNEYVPACAERLLWLTGFSGSAGLAIVLKDEAALFVDGRYTLQARGQTDGAVIDIRHVVEEPPSVWIEAHLKSGERLGYDPWLHTPAAVGRYAKACRAAGGELVAVQSNPVDAIWADRPPAPLAPIRAQPERLAGESAAAKLKRLRAALSGRDGLLVSDAHNVAWLFNIRGGDVAHTPLPLAFAYAPREGRPTLFVDDRKLTEPMRARLARLADIAAPERLVDFVVALGAAGRHVAFDAGSAPARLTQALEEAGGKAAIGADPLGLMKAVKNATELAGTRAAHLRDGAALTRFLAWFDREAPSGHLTEIAATEALESFRRDTGALREISFPTIAGFGPNAALPHYRVSEKSNLKIGRGIFLVDSGGQYEDGTTDITRTMVVGRPSAEMRDRFTRVLKGHIAIARALFPKGTTGGQLDALAREALWRAGLDFDHGTGHGVGAYLSVHEGPQRLSKTDTTAVLPGMILSNEPGYYAPGRFGIRTENLVVVREVKIVGGERATLGFETISFAPIDLRLVEPKLMNRDEIAWLNAYHRETRARLAPLVDAPTRQWLKAATRQLG